MHAWKERKEKKKGEKNRNYIYIYIYIYIHTHTHTYLSNKEIHCIFMTEIIMKQVLITFPQRLMHSE